MNDHFNNTLQNHIKVALDKFFEVLAKEVEKMMIEEKKAILQHDFEKDLKEVLK